MLVPNFDCYGLVAWQICMGKNLHALLLWLSPFNDNHCMHCVCMCVCKCVAKCAGTPAVAAVCERVCSAVCATGVLGQQSCCYPINSAAAGHTGATQRTLGNSRPY